MQEEWQLHHDRQHHGVDKQHGVEENRLVIAAQTLWGMAMEGVVREMGDNAHAAHGKRYMVSPAYVLLARHGGQACQREDADGHV